MEWVREGEGLQESSKFTLGVLDGLLPQVWFVSQGFGQAHEAGAQAEFAALNGELDVFCSFVAFVCFFP